MSIQRVGGVLAVPEAANAEARIPQPPRGVITRVDLVSASRRFLVEVRELPGVVRVFSCSSGIARWFDAPVTEFVEDGISVRAWVTIGVDRHYPAAATIGLVGAYLRARLMESGFDFVQVRVRAALFA